MKHKNFAVLILSHGRPNKMFTIRSLKRNGYTGKWYIVIDNEDETAEEYFKLYGDKVIQFDKSAVKSDTMDNFNGRNIVLYARNKCFDIAKSLNLDYFLVLDDDYKEFVYRYQDGDLLRACSSLRQLDRLFDCMLDFLEATKAKTVAFAQGGDFIGGVGSRAWTFKLLRKAMNSFFFKTNNKVEFLGRLNEDVNAYASLGNRGDLFFTIAYVALNQPQTQTNAGGLTEEYLEKGTYVKSFYTVMLCPSFVKIARTGGGGGGIRYLRIHHKINYRYGYPKIINERYKKQVIN